MNCKLILNYAFFISVIILQIYLMVEMNNGYGYMYQRMRYAEQDANFKRIHDREFGYLLDRAARDKMIANNLTAILCTVIFYMIGSFILNVFGS